MFFLLFYLLVCLLMFFYLKLELFHPLVITYGIWAIVIFSYTYIDKFLYPLTDKIYPIIFFYCFFFLLGVIFYTIAFPVKRRKALFIVENPILKKDFLYDFCFLLNIFLLIKYILYIKQGVTVYQLTVQGSLPRYFKVLSYFSSISLCYFFYLITFNQTSYKDKFYVLIFFLMYILRFSKADVMQIMIAEIMILWSKKKIKIRHLFFILIIMLSLFSFMHLYRTKGQNEGSFFDAIIQMLSTYLLSPVKALDLLINEDIYFVNNMTFSFFSRVVERLFGIITTKPTTFDGFVYVPYPTNVYTAIMPFYSDYKILGVCFFAFLGGFFWILLYRNRYKQYYNLLYCAFVYILVMQFFSDIICSYFSAFLQTCFWCFVIIKKRTDKKFNISIKKLLRSN